jgi:hypothetical protein
MTRALRNQFEFEPLATKGKQKMSNVINFDQLAAPFTLDDIEFRAGATNQEKTQALALAYITSRAVMNRLDEVVGPANWRDEYRPGPDGGVICGLSLRVGGEWITKWDGAENTNFEAIKGGLSDAFKRAAVKWGIGRYLYSTPDFWVPCQVRGKTVVLDQHEVRTRFAQAMNGQPQPQVNEPAPVDGSSQGNGNRASSDPMTAFWTEVRARGFPREKGQELLAQASGDPARALAILQST